jgi:hypothetical protein
MLSRIVATGAGSALQRSPAGWSWAAATDAHSVVAATIDRIAFMAGS